MDEVLQPELLILPLNKNHSHKKFSSGMLEFQPLKSFLQNDALVFQNGCIAQTYVVVDDNFRVNKAISKDDCAYKILGYITLTCSQVNLKDYDLGECAGAQRYEYLPALKIARLAVDSKTRARRIGSMLFEHALMTALDDILPLAGCRFLITDAKRSAIDFYHKKGMELLNTKENQEAEHPIMFIDLLTLL
ncbi:GNAT family N-acetyltransferase [Yersinia enterocolitica]|uniref:GNAT family N-acetyltransferase n=1 Tax=Yersinia enterocolitica TaxID=630 RepID=UPI0021E82437|nr:GNAT family N-acetyltransferase [Yersinia enterocolitica]EKN6079238.1 GNAT family N-acetyltransferase [Yersinia enterocolitica]EKN6113739.1 GNAT family N-acetyltransferase [Yersinia enterocolitica]EKN6297903.1 GNAT family N-acetyltransferase [Yersinia enterocolitica]UYK02526.1 GNAT family N-acetyltransferase [Yersinia enterocolitica]HDL7188956.1 GNAT family N-acetyltransferase [Yersinia enterocolitica]